MPINVIRYRYDQKIRWGLHFGDYIRPLVIPCSTTADLLRLGLYSIKQATQVAGTPIAIGSVELLTPITHFSSALRQDAFYPSVKNLKNSTTSLHFSKSHVAVRERSAHPAAPFYAQHLEVGVGLALVLGKKLTNKVVVTRTSLHEYVVGICIVTDVSAADHPSIQNTHSSKESSLFSLTGPVLCLLDKGEMDYLEYLQLMVSISGCVDDGQVTEHINLNAVAFVSELSHAHDLEIGDILAIPRLGSSKYLHISDRLQTILSSQQVNIKLESNMHFIAEED